MDLNHMIAMYHIMMLIIASTGRAKTSILRYFMAAFCPLSQEFQNEKNLMNKFSELCQRYQENIWKELQKQINPHCSKYHQLIKNFSML